MEAMEELGIQNLERVTPRDDLLRTMILVALPVVHGAKQAARSSSVNGPERESYARFST